MNNFNKLTNVEMQQICGGNPPRSFRSFRFIKSGQEQIWIKDKVTPSVVFRDEVVKSPAIEANFRYVY